MIDYPTVDGRKFPASQMSFLTRGQADLYNTSTIASYGHRNGPLPLSWLGAISMRAAL